MLDIAHCLDSTVAWRVQNTANKGIASEKVKRSSARSSRGVDVRSGPFGMSGSRSHTEHFGNQKFGGKPAIYLLDPVFSDKL